LSEPGILLEPYLVAQTFPQVGWAQLLPDARMGSHPWFKISSDATGTLGYGAIFQHPWFRGPGSASQQSLSIAYKELFPTVVAAYLWGPLWSSRRVKFLCDSELVVAVLSSGTSKNSKTFEHTLLRPQFLQISLKPYLSFDR